MNLDHERKLFEHWYSDEGKYPKAIERAAKGDYLLMQTHVAWGVWQARANVDENEMAARLIDVWSTLRKQPMPWAKVVELVSILSHMPDAERVRLLTLNDPL